MRNFKKYLSVAVIGLVFVCMIPSVLNAAKESHKRNADLDPAPVAEETTDITPTPAPTETTEPAETDKTTDSAAEAPTPEPATPKPIEPEPSVQLGDLPARAGEHGVFMTGDASYFDDALFVGDSRTVDLCEYGTLKNADYYSTTGMSVFNIHERKSTDNPSDLTFDAFIKQKSYGKVYIMLGLNECGYPKSSIVEEYQELIDQIRAAQPDAVIYIQANLLVTAECSETDEYSHNPDLIEVNNREAQLANGRDIVYIDINNLFCLSDGTLDPSKTGDGTHIYAKYCAEWCDWLMTRIAQVE